MNLQRNNRKNILVLNQYYPPDTSATAGILKDTVDVLRENNSVTIIAGRPSYNPRKFHKKYLLKKCTINGVTIERVGSSAFPRQRMAGRIFNYLSYLLLVMIRVLTVETDIIIAMTDPPLVGLVGILSAKIRRKPFIYSIQDLHPDMALAAGLINKSIFVRLWEKVHRWVFRHSDVIVTIGEDMRSRIIEKGISSERVVVIRHGATVSEENNLGENAVSRKISESFSFAIVHAGNIGFYGAWETLIEAVKKLEYENVGITFIGNGADKSRIQKLAGSNKRIRFLPIFSKNDISSVLASGDIHVVTIRRGLEGMVVPSKVYPLLAAGRPILALAPENSDVARIVRKNGCGVVADPDDPDKLVKIVKFLLENRDVLDAMALRSRAIAPEYEKQRSLREFVTLVETIGNIQEKQEFKKIKILRIISRLNIGGPAIHVQQLSQGLDFDKFETILVSGSISRHEGDMGYIFQGAGMPPTIIPELQREINPINDFLAFLKILRILLREKPDVLHTHAAKAGTARVAAYVYARMTNRDIKTLHTFHGNVFEGYFSKIKSRIFIWIEKELSKITDAIIAISDSQKEELVEKYAIADRDRIQKIELGFDLGPFLNCRAKRGGLRKRLNIDADTVLVGIIGRLVPIKNHQLFIDAAKALCASLPEMPIRFIVVGDGECRTHLEASAKAAGLDRYILFTGWIREVAEVYADIDILAMTSLNEGTPVSIIEAMASSVPVVATDVGGVKDLMGRTAVDFNGIKICENGILCPKNDAEKLSCALQYQISSDEDVRESRIRTAKEFVVKQYSRGRLIRDVEALYEELLNPKVSQVGACESKRIGSQVTPN